MPSSISAAASASLPLRKVLETEAELGCLRSEGCHEGQGFLFSKARPHEDLLAMLARQQAQQVA